MSLPPDTPRGPDIPARITEPAPPAAEIEPPSDDLASSPLPVDLAEVPGAEPDHPPLAGSPPTVRLAPRVPTTPLPPLPPDVPPGHVPISPPPSTRRGLIYLALCLAFAAALTLPGLLGNLLPASSAPAGQVAATATPGLPPPCSHGAAIAQAAITSGAPPQLLAVVRPPAVPDNAPGTDPGCYTLYKSDDAGITWTVSFSATAESPTDVDVAPTGQTYALTQRLHFPYYLAANLYYSPARGDAWTWSRVSPQERRAVPMVSASEMLVADDGSVILREANGDGAALVRSGDEGATWQPLLIPRLASVGSVAVLGTLIVVTPPEFSAGGSPGVASRDDGATWQLLGSLPEPPIRGGLHAVLSGSNAERALILELVPDTMVGPGGAVARYASSDGGQHWTLVRCGPTPAPGCAPAARWASAGGERIVLYHRRLWRQANRPAGRAAAPVSSSAGKPCAPGGTDGCAGAARRPWTSLPGPLPVASADVIQVLAAPGLRAAVPYLVTARGIWRLDGSTWRIASSGLPLGFPNPWIG